MSIIRHKADVVAKALANHKFIKLEDIGMATDVILQALFEGGSYQLLEEGQVIHAKTIIRNEKGKVIARQG